MSGVISVHITGRDLNGSNVDVRVTDFAQVGRMIPESFNVLAAEAAALAELARRLDFDPVHRDRTK